MKKFPAICLSLILIFIFSLIPYSALANDEINVYVNGKTVTFDVAPRIINGRTMVPVRAIFEAIGATVEWYDRDKIVLAHGKGYTVNMRLDTNTMTVNYVPVQLDTSLVMIDNRVLAPARHIAEAFNCRVWWDEAQRNVCITTPDAAYDYYSSSSLPDFGKLNDTEPIQHDVQTDESGMSVHSYKYNLSNSPISPKSILGAYIFSMHISGWKTNGIKYDIPDENTAFYYFEKDGISAAIAVQPDSLTNETYAWVLFSTYA